MTLRRCIHGHIIENNRTCTRCEVEGTVGSSWYDNHFKDGTPVEIYENREGTYAGDNNSNWQEP